MAGTFLLPFLLYHQLSSLPKHTSKCVQMMKQLEPCKELEPCSLALKGKLALTRNARKSQDKSVKVAFEQDLVPQPLFILRCYCPFEQDEYQHRGWRTFVMQQEC